MDGRRFDEVAKALAVGAPRRAVLKALLGGAAATVAGAFRVRRSDSRQQACQTDGDCPASFRCCGGVCRDVPNDPNHCGGCDSPCPAGPSMICCDGLCADAATSRNHCGGCNNPCADGACIGGECCPAAGVCFGTCCAAGEVCLSPPAVPTPRTWEELLAAARAIAAGLGVCCPPRQVCDDFCCPNGQECAVANFDLVCCPVDRICAVGPDSVECCQGDQVCFQGSGCGTPGEGGDATAGNATAGDEPRQTCVPRGGRRNFRRAPALTQDVPGLCETDADCCEEGDRCVDGVCVPADGGGGDQDRVTELVDLSQDGLTESNLGVALSRSSGAIFTGPAGLVAPNGLAVGDVLATPADFLGGHQAVYSIAPADGAAAPTTLTALGMAFASPEVAAAVTEALFAARSAQAIDVTRGDEGDPAYTIEFPVVAEDDPGLTGTALESGFRVPDTSTVGLIRTAFFGPPPDPDLYFAALERVKTAYQARQRQPGYSPGAAFLPAGGPPSIAWQHLKVDGVVQPLTGEAPEQTEARATEFGGATSALGYNLGPYSFTIGGADGDLTFRGRVLTFAEPEQARAYAADYPAFTALLQGQGVVGALEEPPVSFGEETKLYRFTTPLEDGVVPGMTIGGAFPDLSAVGGPPLFVSLTLRAADAVPAEDEAAIRATQDAFGGILAQVAEPYAGLIQTFPYGGPPRFFLLPLPPAVLQGGDAIEDPLGQPSCDSQEGTYQASYGLRVMVDNLGQATVVEGGKPAGPMACPSTFVIYASARDPVVTRCNDFVGTVNNGACQDAANAAAKEAATIACADGCERTVTEVWRCRNCLEQGFQDLGNCYLQLEVRCTPKEPVVEEEPPAVAAGDGASTTEEDGADDGEDDGADGGAEDGGEPAGDLPPDFAYNSALWTELGGDFGYLQAVGGTFPQLEAAGFFDLSTVALSGAQVQRASVVRFARPVTPGLTTTSPLGIGAGFEVVSLQGATPGDIDLVLPVLQSFPTFGLVVEGSDVGIPDEVAVTYGALEGGAVVSSLSRLGDTALMVALYNVEGGQADLNDARRLTAEWWRRFRDVLEGTEPTLGQQAARVEGAAEEAYFAIDGQFAPPLDPAVVASDVLKPELHFGAGYREVLVEDMDRWPGVTLYGLLQRTPQGLTVGTAAADFGDAEAAGAFLLALPDFVAANAQRVSQTVEVEESSEDGLAYGGFDATGLPFYALARRDGSRVVAVQLGLTVPGQPDAAACREAFAENAERLLAGFDREPGVDLFGLDACLQY